MTSACFQNLAFIEGVGGPELMMIMFVVLLLFGGKKLPELAKGLGKSVREFKKAASGVEEEFKRAIEEAPEASTPAATPAPTASAKPVPPAVKPASDDHAPPHT